MEQNPLTKPEELAKPYFGRHAEVQTHADEMIHDINAVLMSTEQAKLITSCYRKHGEPFAAFLMLDDTNIESKYVEDDFIRAFHSEHSASLTFAEHWAEVQQWPTLIGEFMANNDIPEGCLELDLDQVQCALDDVFDTVEIQGNRYLFWK